MPVDHMKVMSLITDAMMKQGAHPLGPADPAKVELARKDLKAQRNVPGKSLDTDLAAAEYYLLMRSWVGQGIISVNQAVAMVYGYEGAKIGLKAIGKEDLLQHNPSEPVSKPDKDVVQWGLQGIAHGEADRRAFNPTVEAPLVNLDAIGFKSPLMDSIRETVQAVKDKTNEVTGWADKTVGPFLPWRWY